MNKATERIKKTEKKPSILDGISLALPALMRAEKLQKRTSHVGFDWPETKQVLDKINEESLEIVEAYESGEPQSRIHEEVGDLMFVVANLARKLGVDPEHALRDANQKFTDRFQYIEDNAPKPMQNMELSEMEALWIEAKTKT
ncbi:MAG: MazG nucleotide pyrophosphohydrolase domain-containing protein [Robiginitomaculum sp.]